MPRTPDLIAPAAEGGAEGSSASVRRAAHEYYQQHYGGNEPSRDTQVGRVWSVDAVERALRRGSRVPKTKKS